MTGALARGLAAVAWAAIACALSAFLLGGCAEPVVPYVRTQVVGDWRMDWFADGPPLRIRAVNPTRSRARFGVQCVGAASPWTVDLPARGEAFALGQVMNAYAPFDPCWVVEPR